MRASPLPPSAPDAIEAAAAQWLARRDRGLKAPEQTAYTSWLSEDLRHEAAVTRLEKIWHALDALSELPAAQATLPNPDLLAPRRSHRRLWVWSPLLAAAAAVAFL